MRKNDDIAELIIGALGSAGGSLNENDVVVVKQKIVSKAEGRVVRLEGVKPSRRAVRIANGLGKEPQLVELILRESRRIVRMGHGVIITETKHGFVCASAGVDASNAPEAENVVLLPVDPDASAERIRSRLRELTGHQVAVVVSDSFGRPFRVGIAGVAIGVSGFRPLLDLRGQHDRNGYELHATIVAVADEVAAAAELVMGKTDAIPAAIVRGLQSSLLGEGRATELVMPPERDLFRSE